MSVQRGMNIAFFIMFRCVIEKACKLGLHSNRRFDMIGIYLDIRKYF